MDFQKEMTGFYIHSVCLPEKVRKHFNDFACKILEFKCPSSTDVWHVELIGSGDKLVLQSGWNDFVSSNNVLQNDLLLFKLVGGCTFEVRILDPFGREKGGDFEGEADEDKVQEGTGKSTKNHTRKRSWGQNCNSLPLKKRLKKSDCDSPCQENEKTESKEQMHRLLSEVKEEFLERDGEYEISSVKKINCYVEKMIEETRNDNLVVLEHQTLLRRRLGLVKNENQHSSQNPIDFAYVPPCWKVMSTEQKARANRLAVQVQAGNPAFLHLIKKQSKRPSIVIPKEFSAKHLQKRNQTFILSLPEKENTWPVKYYSKRNQSNTIERTSFNKFIKENNLKEGDVCVFELIRTADQISFIVHVSRAI